MSKKKFDLSRGLKTVKTVITANSPVLLVGATITGVVATGVLAAKAGYKARGIVDEEKARRGAEAVADKTFDTYLEEKAAYEAAADLTTREKAELTWLCYAAPAITGASTIASCMGVHLIHTKRHAALAGLYAITAGKLDDYKDMAEEALGTKKQQEFQDRMAQKAVDGAPFDNRSVMMTGGHELCFDTWTSRYFMSSMSEIADVVNQCNALLIDDGELDLNTFYERLGLEGVPWGLDFGWSKAKTDKISINYGNVTAPDGRPAIAISFRNDPRPDFSR